ncbi:cellulase family glycosylhydrolase [Sunxiuqinia indica]|uniref:cellulase family glycosylhydrolase n=1 Tax=Sunxiuqinia indica TaxID=2692584 RepID=UPI0013573EE4|nr:cellulase family glycosylhydrolase [Sunxiuqinia indica]
MKRTLNILLSIIALISIFSEVNAQFDSSDFLKTDGPVMKNESGSGEVVSLRGTNLGSWLSMEHWIGPLGYGAINRDNWQVYSSGSVSTSDLDFIIDGNDETVWQSGVTQNGDGSQWLIFSLNEKLVFDRVLIKSGENTNESPVQYVIEISTDSINWTQIANSSGGSSQISFNTGAIEAKYVRYQVAASSNANWAVAEFYLMMNDDYSVRNATYDRFGVEAADQLWDYYQQIWITTADLDSIKAMGMNMVRVPFYWMEIMNNDGTIKEYAFDQLDWLVAECSKREIYVMLDLHGAPGGLDGYITSGQAVTNELWNDPEAQKKTVDLWKAVAEHFKGEPTVAAYDLMNEPVSNNPQFTISDMYDKIYQEVRKIDPDHIISVQAFYNFDMIASPGQKGWENVLYQAHYYNTDFENRDSQNGFINYALSDMAWHQKHWNVPVLAGEYNFWNHLDLWGKWMLGLNSFNASWSNWCYKNNTNQYNWGLYLGNNNPVPELSFDPVEEIKMKWDQFKTPKFFRNDKLIDTIRNHTQEEVFRGIDKYVWFQAYNGTYVSSKGGDVPMTCNSVGLGDQEIFKIVDANDGQIALQGNNGKYVSSNNGMTSMTCSKSEIGESEKFYWINLPNHEVALLGLGGFVSMEDGSIPMNANRRNFDGWEIFTWGTKDVATSSREFEHACKLYPNPLAPDQVLNYTLPNLKNTHVAIYNSDGKKVYHNKLAGSGSIDLSDLSSGVYLVITGNYREKLIVP